MSGLDKNVEFGSDEQPVASDELEFGSDEQPMMPVPKDLIDKYVEHWGETGAAIAADMLGSAAVVSVELGEGDVADEYHVTTQSPEVAE